MATKNPRLTITLEPSLAAQLRRLSSLTGNSQAALISDLLAGSWPVFDRMIDVLEAAEAAKAAMRGKLVDDMHQAQERIEEQLGLALEPANDSRPMLLVDAEKVLRRAARRGPALRGSAARREQATPPSNRGVRSKPKTAQKPSGTRT